ncbi:MAG: hypothetical protein ACREBU_00465 [Nitrososphaera sp.]
MNTNAPSLSVDSFLSAAAVESRSIKATPGRVYALHFFSINGAARFLRLYNQTTAPVAADNANIVWRGIIPGSTAGAGFSLEFPNGLGFSAGIGMRCTAAIGDTDATALAANEVIGDVCFR